MVMMLMMLTMATNRKTTTEVEQRCDRDQKEAGHQLGQGLWDVVHTLFRLDPDVIHTRVRRRSGTRLARRAWLYRLTHNFLCRLIFTTPPKMLKCLNVDSRYATTTTIVTVWRQINELVYSETWRTALRATPTPIPAMYIVRSQPQ